MGTCLRNKLTAFCPDWKSLDFYIVLLGLAFCRAWIVLCLSAAAVTTLVTGRSCLPAPPLPLALPLQRDALQRRIDSRRECAV